jgi:hypothetical protein
VVDIAWPLDSAIHMLKYCLPELVDIISLYKYVLHGVKILFTKRTFERSLESPFAEIFHC